MITPKVPNLNGFLLAFSAWTPVLSAVTDEVIGLANNKENPWARVVKANFGAAGAYY
jgi:hypothetical protein